MADICTRCPSNNPETTRCLQEPGEKGCPGPSRALGHKARPAPTLLLPPYSSPATH